jgi:antitoxin (DNA-binding transcriptional repressor) of toxin-antitoxin stability system
MIEISRNGARIRKGYSVIIAKHVVVVARLDEQVM